MTDLKPLLENIPLFHALDERHLARLAAAVRRATYQPGEELMRIGGTGGSLFLVLQGQVSVLYPAQGSEFEMARLGSGEHLGEMSLLNGQPRSATVRAVDEVEVGILDQDAFRQAALDEPALTLHVLETLSVRMRGADEHISILSDMAMRDALTGLLNRRAFQDRVKQEADRARRYLGEFTVILFDLDRFKMVNDTLGHDVGDRVLRWIGRILAEHTRASDSPFRIGGEEFAVLCPATGLEAAAVAAERLVRIISTEGPPEDAPHVTTSAGYASCPEHGTTFEELYRAADQTLLRAKEEGGDRVGTPQTVEEE